MGWGWGFFRKGGEGRPVGGRRRFEVVPEPVPTIFGVRVEPTFEGGGGWNRYVHTHVHSSTTHDSQRVETTQMSINR